MFPKNPHYKAEYKRREEGIDKVCNALHTSRMYICDQMALAYSLLPSIDPIKLRTWLEKFGNYYSEAESMREYIVRRYGEDMDKLIESLF